jgi:hypothetical protein
MRPQQTGEPCTLFRAQGWRFDDFPLNPLQHFSFARRLPLSLASLLSLPPSSWPTGQSFLAVTAGLLFPRGLEQRPRKLG